MDQRQTVPLIAGCAENSKRPMENVSQLEINTKSILEEVSKFVVSTTECSGRKSYKIKSLKIKGEANHVNCSCDDLY